MKDVAHAVARLAGPAIAHSLLHTLMFLVDRAMLGRHSAAALASMQISGPVVWSLSSLVGAVQVGAVAVVGRAVGEGRRDEAAAAVRAALGASLVLGGAAGALGLLALPWTSLAFPHAGEAVCAASRAYLEVVLASFPLLLLGSTAGAVHQAAGDTRTPFLVALAANGVNAIANWLLIFGHAGLPALGARGAALGSAIAMALECGVLGALLVRGRGVVSMRGRGGERQALARIGTVASAAAAERLAQHVGFLSFVGMIGALGPVAMAANQTLISIESIAFLTADGFGIAAAAMVAQRLGARRPDEASAAAKLATAMAIVALSLCGVGWVAAGRALASLFTDDPAILEAAVPCLAVAAVAQPFMASAVVLGEALRGAGATRATLVVTLLGGLVVRLAATWLFAFRMDLGLLGVWMGSTLDWMVRTGLLVALFARGGWARTRL